MFDVYVKASRCERRLLGGLKPHIMRPVWIILQRPKQALGFYDSSLPLLSLRREWLHSLGHPVCAESLSCVMRDGRVSIGKAKWKSAQS